MQALERLPAGVGVAAVRIMAGVILFLSGYSKLTGAGVAGVAGFLGNVGISLPDVMAPLLIGFEVIGGLLLILGAFVRILGPMMIVEFLVAGLMVTLPSQQGWNAARLDFLLLATGVLFLFAGAGAFSVDNWLMSRRRSGERVRAPA